MSMQFKKHIKNKYKMGIRDFLKMMAKKGYSYQSVADEIGYDVATIEKYCRSHSITLKKSPEQVHILDTADFYANSINKINALSRSWGLG
jgi:hypothetical protein